MRQAILNANALAGPDTIRFDSTNGSFATPQTIVLESELPDLVGEVTIDGRGVFVEDFSGLLNEHPVRVRGSRLWDKTLDIEVEGEGVSTDEVALLIDQDLGFKARGALEGTFKLMADTLHYEGIFTGDLEGQACPQQQCTHHPQPVPQHPAVGIILCAGLGTKGCVQPVTGSAVGGG